MTSDILNLLPSSIYWIQEPTKNFLGCNRYFLTAHNDVVESEAIGKSIDTIFSGEYLKLINNFLKKNNKNTKKTVIYFDNLDSLRKPLLIQYSRSLSGDIGVFSEIFIDEKILHKDLWKEKEKLLTYLNNIVEYIPASIYWKDKNSVILGGSQLHAEIAGYSDRKEVIGKTDDEFIWKDQAERIIKNDQFVMHSNGTLIFEETAKLRDGNIHTFLTRKSPLKGKLNETIGVLGVSFDITELKETQSKLEISLKRAEIANQAKTEFLENMRHDIRTPLSGIVGCAYLIQMQADNPKKVTEYADDLVKSSDALLVFLNKILESITVASGEIPILKKKFDLQKVLKEIIRLNQSQAAVKNLALSLDYDATIPAYLIGDPIRTQSIILELVTNALKFTDKGEIKVSTRLMEYKKYEVVIKLSVSDTGMGIPHDKQHEVYTRFKRLTPSCKGVYPGTGLGLSVVKQFLDDLGGEIYLDSEVGKGSNFTCLVAFQKPLLMDDTGIGIAECFETNDPSINKRVTNNPSISNVSISDGSHVLVVEDQTIAARVAQSILSELDCQVDIASDGKTALENIEKKHYDLVLMDVGLPDNDGCEVTRRVRLKQRQHNPFVPIIGLTAHIAAEKRRSCIDAGMNAIYTKPLTPEKAFEILNAFIPYQQQSKMANHKPPEPLKAILVLDIEQAVQIMGSQELVKEVLDLLVSRLSEDLKVIKQYHKANDWSAIRGMANKWKGGASYCGASCLEQACHQLEAALQAESFEEAKVLYKQLLQVAIATKEAAKKAIVYK